MYRKISILIFICVATLISSNEINKVVNDVTNDVINNTTGTTVDNVIVESVDEKNIKKIYIDKLDSDKIDSDNKDIDKKDIDKKDVDKKDKLTNQEKKLLKEQKKEIKKEERLLKKEQKKEKNKEKVFIRNQKKELQKELNAKEKEEAQLKKDEKKFIGGLTFAVGGCFSDVSNSYLFRYSPVYTDDIPVINQIVKKFNAPVYLSNLAGFDTSFMVAFSYYKKKNSSMGFVNRIGYKFLLTDPFSHFIFDKQFRILNTFFTTLEIKNTIGSFDKNTFLFMTSGFYFSVFFQNYSPEKERVLPYGVGIGPTSEIGLEYHKNNFVYKTSIYCNFIFRLRGKYEDYLTDSDLFMEIDIGVSHKFGYLTKKRFIKESNKKN